MEKEDDQNVRRGHNVDSKMKLRSRATTATTATAATAATPVTAASRTYDHL